MLKKEREYLFDNLKAILIILVVLGHIIEYLELKGIIAKINAVIYLFHMPFFIFISGYFSKNLKDIERKNIKNLLIPFFLFNICYIILLKLYKKDIDINIFEPRHAYWYLFSLCTWKILINYVKKLKFSMVLLILLSLYIGTISSINRNFSLSRTIAFFPFFMLGYYTDKEIIEKIRKIDKKIIIFILIFMACTLFMTKDVFTFGLLKNAESYHTSDVSNTRGILVRVLQFVFAIGISGCIINLIPDKKNWLSDIGKKTITVYLLSPIVQFVLSNYIIYQAPEILSNKFISISICIISTIFIVWFFSRNVVFNIYNKLIDWIYRVIIIKEDDKKLKKEVYCDIDKL